MSTRTTPTPAPTPLDDDRVTELVTRAAYERLRSDLAVAHGTELVSWDEQNPKMRGDLRESVEPTVQDTIEAIAELGFAVVPYEWLGGQASDATAVVIGEATLSPAATTPNEVDIDLPASPQRLLTLASMTSRLTSSTNATAPGEQVADESEPVDPSALRGLVSGAGSAAVAIVRLPQTALRPIKRVVARVMGPAA